jgi:hypothetical protein
MMIKVDQDVNYADEVPEKCEIVDGVMVRGLSIDRNQNSHPKEYVCFKENDEMGLITYTPKYLTENN